MHRSSRRKTNKKIVALNDTLDQIDLIGIFRAFHSKASEYTFFSNAYETFSKVNPILGHKTSLTKFEKFEIISSIFSDHNGMKLEINHKNTENTQ